MPLKHSASPEAFTANMKAELGAGKPQKQALAISYAVQKQAAIQAHSKKSAPPTKKK